jgi:hypothetical protein
VSDVDEESVVEEFPRPRRSVRKKDKGQATPVDLPPLPSKRKGLSAAEKARAQVKDKATARSAAYKLSRSTRTVPSEEASSSTLLQQPEFEDPENLDDPDDPIDIPDFNSPSTYTSYIEAFMANQGGNAAPANAGGNNAPAVSHFKIPQKWDRGSPEFTTDDPDELLEFVEQVRQIIRLAGITDEKEKKDQFLSYLDWKRKKAWKVLATYSAGTFEEFLKEIYKSYPEIDDQEVGTLEALYKLCKLNQGIQVSEEGKLRRFGILFKEQYQKLIQAPSQITNNYSRECVFKEEAINKGHLIIENGKAKLGDGNFIPRGPGSQRMRVDDYWRNKALGQSYYSQPSYQQYYNQEENEQAYDASEAAFDEIRTLKVKLARAQQANGSSNFAKFEGVVQPTFLANTQPAQSNSAMPQGFDLSKVFQLFLMSQSKQGGDLPETQDQFAVTRSRANGEPSNF